MIETLPKAAFKPDGQIEDWLKNHGAVFEGARIPVASVDIRRSLQNQARFQPLEESLVATYSEAMSEGTRFPPIVVLDDGKAGGYLVLDGNHRVAAAQVAGVDTLDAYILTGANERLTAVLTFDANTRHGLPTSPEERKQHAVYLVETAGISQKEAARMLNVGYADLGKSLAISRASRRMAALGIERWQNIAPSNRGRLGAIQSDVVFKAAADLAVLARLGTVAVSDFVTEINTTSTEADGLAAVEAERARQQDRIGATLGGRTSLPKSAMRLSRSLAYLEQINVEDFDKTMLDPALTQRFEQRLLDGIATYQAILGKLD